MILKIKDDRQLDFYVEEYLFTVDGDLPYYSTSRDAAIKVVEWFEENSTEDEFTQFKMGMSIAASMFWRDTAFPAMICSYILNIKCDITIEKEITDAEKEEAEEAIKASREEIPKATRQDGI